MGIKESPPVVQPATGQVAAHVLAQCQEPTYAPDDIWGVGLYRKQFFAARRHVIRIEVLGEHSPRAKDSYLHLDGFRVE